MALYSIKKATKVEFILNRLITDSCVENSKFSLKNHLHIEVYLIEEVFGIKGLRKDDLE